MSQLLVSEASVVARLDTPILIMSASAGDVNGSRAQSDPEKSPGIDAHRHPSSDRDVERGDPDAEKLRNTPDDELNEDDVYNEPDEYTRLLKYIDFESKKEKHSDVPGDDEEEEGKMQRVWYAPWKKRRVGAQGNKKIPASWLETEMLKGLTNEEAANRRSRVGYNELERCVYSLARMCRY
jgi:H+-transporting ATPase